MRTLISHESIPIGDEMPTQVKRINQKKIVRVSHTENIGTTDFVELS